MKQVLIVKTSSLGDIIHTLPAVTEAAWHIPNIQFDWVVEKNLAEIPAWHPAIRRVIPVPFRQLRKHPLKMWRHPEWQNFRQKLRENYYDLVIDAQGLLKSAFIAYLARGQRCGLSWQSAREPLASLVYQKKCSVERKQHAVIRNKALFAQALDYAWSKEQIDYGINVQQLSQAALPSQHYFVFLHGTTWPTKYWPENYWQQLLDNAVQHGYDVLLPWGNEAERQRAECLADNVPKAHVLPKLTLAQITYVLAHAKAVVAVDTGLGHLAAAMHTPTVNLYGPTDPKLTGTQGNNQYHLAARFPCAPCLQKKCTYTKASDAQPACFSTVTPQRVWEKLQRIITN